MERTLESLDVLLDHAYRPLLNTPAMSLSKWGAAMDKARAA
jgi:hypothetical protein